MVVNPCFDDFSGTVAVKCDIVNIPIQYGGHHSCVGGNIFGPFAYAVVVRRLPRGNFIDEIECLEDGKEANKRFLLDLKRTGQFGISEELGGTGQHGVHHLAKNGIRPDIHEFSDIVEQNGVQVRLEPLALGTLA